MPSTTSETTQDDLFDTFPMDFSAYLGKRLGDRGAAMTALGRWLRTYEPAVPHPHLAAAQPRRSGVFPSPAAEDPKKPASTLAA